MRRRMTSMTWLVAMLLATISAAAVAQEDTAEPFVIQLVDLTEAEGGSDGDIRIAQGALTAVVDGVECVIVDVTTPEPPALVIGEADQPDACHQAGATVTLFNARGGELVEQFEVQPGERAELVNFGPVPFHLGPILPADVGGGVVAEARAGSTLPIVALVAGLTLLVGSRLLTGAARLS